MALTFGYAEPGNTAGARAGFFIEPTTITEGVALLVTDFNTTATLGAADATVTGGSASVSATATMQIKDPIANDPHNVITQADLTQTGTMPPSMVSPTLASTASLTLPISSSLVVGGPQTLAPELIGLSRERRQLQPVQPRSLEAARHDLAGAVAEGGRRAARADLDGRGRSRVRRGDASTREGLGKLLTIRNDFSTAATAAGGAASLSQVATALQNAGISVTFAIDTPNDALDMPPSASSTFDTSLPYTIDVLAGSGPTHAERLATGQRHGDGVAPSRSVVRHHAGGQRPDPIS